MTQLFAAPATATAPAALGAGGIVSVTLALLVVLVAIFVLAWIARRLRTFGARAGGALEVLASMSLGAKERAVLIRVGDAQILLGVAPGQVNTLHVLERAVSADKPAMDGEGPARPSFAALLKRSLGK